MINKSCTAAGVWPRGGPAAPNWQVALPPAVGLKVSHFLSVGKSGPVPGPVGSEFQPGEARGRGGRGGKI
jgi:hypothetical protein